MKKLLTVKRGVFDFVLQRLTAVVLGIYVIHLVVVVSMAGGWTFTMLQTYFSSPYVQVLTSLVVVAIIVHAWIGLWTVGTDYLPSGATSNSKSLIRLIYEGLIVIALVVYLLWSLNMIWGVV